MNWKIFTATAAIGQIALIVVASIATQIWEINASLFAGNAGSWFLSFYVALPVTLIGLALVLVGLRESRQRMRLIGLALSSGLILHFSVIGSLILWIEFELPPRIPLWGLISGSNTLTFQGKFGWFEVVGELSVVLLLVLALGVFFSIRVEKALMVLPNASAAVDCESCGKPQENTNKFCTSCGTALEN